MAQMTDSLMSSARSTPKDVQVMAAILKEMGINDYEPRVLNQMLEFTYRYVSNIIDDAQLYSTHAKKKSIDTEDVMLAIHLQQERNFTNAPDREVTVDMAKQRNNMSLPLIKSSAGLRLPPDRYSLTACNYRLKSSSKKARTVHTVSRLNLSSNSGSKNSSSLTNVNKPGSISAIVTKPSNTLLTTVTRPITNISKTVTTPIIKFSDGNRIVTTTSTLSPLPSVVATSISQPTSVPQILMPTVGVLNTDLKLPTEAISLKRKHEDDDDYDIEV